ncbi:hypothetical protein K505DRAFT_325698 [Melanomma pulvis-pyrius CBS 109.77]|uniref:Uncharacterized protein n=1 Tax=Melanomma pulvis-pyrius CBS 109.77 TaxID=1314802 RepID=A0A6A6XA10_9PLEO|nr:hypothetical protein K505DRAFT_325698 [Melanomma pulvis-pyrius CBS 109.77]
MFALFASQKVSIAHQHHTLLPPYMAVMPPSRAYVPSAAVLRALSRPIAPRCPLLPRLPTQFIRGKRKVAKPEVDEDARQARQMKVLQRRLLEKAKEEAKERQAKMAERPPLPTDTMDEMGMPEISWWEQDLDKPGKPMTLISRIATRADFDKHQKTAAMMEERDRNPNYDDAELNKRLMDDLIANPNFADLTEALQAIKATIKTKEEKAELERKVAEDMEPTEKELQAMSKMAIDGALQELLEDPDLVEYQQDVRDVREKLPEGGDLDTPEFVEAMEDLEKKLEGNEAYQLKLEKWRKEQQDNGGGMSEEMRKIEAMLDAEEAAVDMEDPDANVPENMEDLLYQMRELLSAMNDDKSKELRTEIDALMQEDPEAQESPEEEEKELDFDFLVNEINKIRDNPPPAPESSDIEVVDPDLEAKVDRIMEDPQLIEKLAYINKMIKAQKKSLINPDIESPPDPLTLSDAETTTLEARLKIAENDPEHIAALRSLRINLLPPFSVSPALRSLNQALKIAYCCSNDGVRRILWRSYFKARSLPTLLQNMPDDAWDMMYYSQAVKWEGNENRENHLRIILADLRSVGKDGPPTHPSTLRKGS